MAEAHCAPANLDNNSAQLPARIAVATVATIAVESLLVALLISLPIRGLILVAAAVLGLVAVGGKLISAVMRRPEAVAGCAIIRAFVHAVLIAELLRHVHAIAEPAIAAVSPIGAVGI